LHGEHQVSNTLAAVAVALAAGMDLDHIVRRLSTVSAASPSRMSVTRRADGVIVIDDAYNANPDSVQAALKALVAMGRGISDAVSDAVGDAVEGAGAKARPRRTWAVLGEMLELGSISVEEHDRIGRLAVRLNVSRLIAVGEGARGFHQGAAQEGSWGDEAQWVPDVASARRVLHDELQPGDVVLVKASRAVGLEHLARWLVDDVQVLTDAPTCGEPAGGRLT
jgi:UDP-N-acetylmuramoyl-tripeptide--D-alanyl-D-alanine ligase